MAKLMVSRGADMNAVDKQGASPLRVAVNSGNLQLVSFFLDRNAEGINEKVNGVALIDLACLRKHFDVVDLLAQHGATTSDRMLKIALKDSNLKLLRLCVSNAKLEVPQTALYVACKKGDLDLARILVEDRHLAPDLSCVKYALESREPKLERWMRVKASEELAKKCLACGKFEGGEGNVKLLRCGKCKMVKFCSVACQKAEQKAHAGYCMAPPEKL